MKILIVDNHILFREGLVALLEKQSGIEVVDAISNHEDLLERARLIGPDFVIMDLEWPDLGGIEKINEIQKSQPETKVIILTHDESDELLFATFRNGAQGFLHKDIPVSKLVNSLRAVERGEAVMPRKMMKLILEEFVRLSAINLPLYGLSTASLTQREAEVLGLLRKGATNEQIANHLSISYNTVKIHIHHILRKLNLRNRSEVMNLINRLR